MRTQDLKAFAEVHFDGEHKDGAAGVNALPHVRKLAVLGESREQHGKGPEQGD